MKHVDDHMSDDYYEAPDVPDDLPAERAFARAAAEIDDLCETNSPKCMYATWECDVCTKELCTNACVPQFISCGVGRDPSACPYVASRAEFYEVDEREEKA